MNKRIIADISLLLVALVWGTTFVVVQKAIATLPPHSFNGIRFGLASIALFLIILILDRKSLKNMNWKVISAGIILGVLLFGGYAFQTIGLLFTSAAKAGFITGLNIVLVPLFSVLLLKIWPKWPTILGVLLAAIGLYFLTMVGESSFEKGDLFVFFCAIFFALQIVFTGKYAPSYSSLILAWLQVTVVAILSILFAIFDENLIYSVHLDTLLAKDVLMALIITSIFATALAFLAQTTFQKYTTPTRVAIIFAMEPVFAALTSLIVQQEKLSSYAVLGGFLIFLGMILAEVPVETLHSIFRLHHKKTAKKA